MQYTITKVSEQTPREWANPNGGTVYYIKVMVNGHEKPIEVGKKSPDALKVGDTINGDITPTEYSADKFKAVQQAYSGGAGARRTEDPAKQDSIMKMNALNNAVAFTSNPMQTGVNIDYQLALASEYYLWLKGETSGYEAAKKTAETIKEKTKEIDDVIDGDPFAGLEDE